jgi:hypothetical protein
MGRQLAPGIGTVWVSPQEGGLHKKVSFSEGDEIPDWAAEKMGDHCFTGIRTGDDEDAFFEEDPEYAPPGDNGVPANTAGGDVPPPPPAAAPDYSSLNKAALQAEVEKRNEGREPDDLIVVEGQGNVPDLVAALQADDVAQSSNG